MKKFARKREGGMVNRVAFAPTEIFIKHFPAEAEEQARLYRQDVTGIPTEPPQAPAPPTSPVLACAVAEKVLAEEPRVVTAEEVTQDGVFAALGVVVTLLALGFVLGYYIART